MQFWVQWGTGQKNISGYAHCKIIVTHNKIALHNLPELWPLSDPLGWDAVSSSSLQRRGYTEAMVDQFYLPWIKVDSKLFAHL